MGAALAIQAVVQSIHPDLVSESYHHELRLLSQSAMCHYTKQYSGDVTCRNIHHALPSRPAVLLIISVKCALSVTTVSSSFIAVCTEFAHPGNCYHVAWPGRHAVHLLLHGSACQAYKASSVPCNGACMRTWPHNTAVWTHGSLLLYAGGATADAKCILNSAHTPERVTFRR